MATTLKYIPRGMIEQNREGGREEGSEGERERGREGERERGREGGREGGRDNISSSNPTALVTNILKLGTWFKIKAR